MSSIAYCPAPPSTRPVADASRLGAFFRRIALAITVRAERRALMSLDETALKDMGFSSGQAHREYGRSFWDVPVDRLRH
jgi:uncharacterized protein YjiS (DUF1127 family)